MPAVCDFLKHKKFLFVGSKKFLPPSFSEDEVWICRKAGAFQKWTQNPTDKGGERNRDRFESCQLRVEQQIRTPFLKADFHSDFVKILANTASIGCVFAASDSKSALEKSSTSMGGDFEGFVSQSGEGRLSPFKNDWGRKTRNIPHWGGFGFAALPYLLLPKAPRTFWGKSEEVIGNR